MRTTFVSFSGAALALILAASCGGSPARTAAGAPATSTDAAGPAPSASLTPTASPPAAPRSGPRPANAILVADVDAALRDIGARSAAEASGGAPALPSILDLARKLGFDAKDLEPLRKEDVEPDGVEPLDGNLDADAETERVLTLRFTSPEPPPTDDPTAAFGARFFRVVVLVAWLDRSGPDWVPVAHEAFEVGGMGPSDIGVEVAHVRSEKVDDTVVRLHSGAPPRTAAGYYAVEIYALEHGKLERIADTGPCPTFASVDGHGVPFVVRCDERLLTWSDAHFAYE